MAIESQVIFKIRKNDSAFILIAAYYVFNISYPKGLETFFYFFEHIILDKKPKKVPSTMNQFLSLLNDL